MYACCAASYNAHWLPLCWAQLNNIKDDLWPDDEDGVVTNEQRPCGEDDATELDLESAVGGILPLAFFAVGAPASILVRWGPQCYQGS